MKSEHLQLTSDKTEALLIVDSKSVKSVNIKEVEIIGIQRQCRTQSMLLKIQWKLAICIISFDLMTQDRKQCHRRNESVKANERKVILRKWQHRWEKENTKGNRTRRLVPDVELWIKRKHGGINLKLLLGRHGFEAYLNRLNLINTPNCHYCGQLKYIEPSYFKTRIENNKDEEHKYKQSHKIWQFGPTHAG